MSDIRFNQWLHNSGTGGVSQVDGGHVGIGTTNPEIAVHSGNNKILNVGIVTASSYYGDGSNLSGIVGGGTSLSFNDNIGAYFGNSQDLKIHHDGNHSYIDDQGTGNLRLRSGTLEILNLAGNKTSAIFSSGAGQTLNFNNNQRFATTNAGATLNGALTATGSFYVSGSQNAELTNNQLIFDRAGYSYIDNNNDAGSLNFRVTSSNTIALRLDNSAQAIFASNVIIPDAIQHNGDLDTKIRFPEDNKISFETGGTERLRIDNVGVLYTGNYTTTLDATPGSMQMSGGTSGARLSLRGTTTSAYGGLGEIHGFWDTNKVASILFHAGGDTTNKDDGEIRMYTRTSGGGSSERFGISTFGNIRWRAGSVHQRKTGAFLGIAGAGTSDIKICGNFENNDMIRVRWAYNWNAGDGGAWGEAVIWKQYEGTKRVRYLTDVKASPLTSVSFPHSGNDIWLRWQTNGGINGFYMIDVETHGCEPFPF